MQVGSTFRGTFDFEAPEFDWQEVRSPGHALKDLIIYEVPVRSFTASKSSNVPDAMRGTYLGLAAKASYLKELGINAVELLPVFEYDELEFQRDKNKRDHMVNVWGYSHMTFFAPMSRFAAGGAGAAAASRDFKHMVKQYSFPLTHLM
jgi:isoamylase